MTVGIDEGGKARNYLPYNIDTLPGLKKTGKANMSSLSLIDLPVNRRKTISSAFKKILIAFGGEDSAELSSVLIKTLLKYKIFRPESITLVKGFLFKHCSIPANIKILDSPDNLKEELYKYDLVFTLFGLTCFEALSANVPVILLNPSNYHRKLCEDNNLPEIGVCKPLIRKIRYLLNNPELLINCAKRVVHELELELELKHGSILEHELSQLVSIGRTKKIRNVCPVCNTALNSSTARFKLRSYFKCRSCKTVYLLSFKKEKKVYEKDYFNKEYYEQYGKTYVEDFEKIKKMSYNRILRILKLIKRSESLRVLDVGCAYGPFLKACKDMGLESSGLDISTDAVNYVENKLKLPCTNISFIDYNCGSKFDIITMWFVLEHFKEPGIVLKKVNMSLKLNGVFAFSTPNLKGISGKSNIQNFIKNSPEDHFTILSPGAAKKILRLYGFKVRKIKITGHHPERFKIRKTKNSILWKLVLYISKIFMLGDTFEIYAVKIKEI